MQIRELEAKTGLDRATIRFYEREGFIQPQRHDNGYRDYSADDSETLLKIKLLRKLGISLERIQDLQQGRAYFSDALTEQISALEDRIQSAQSAKNVCEQMRCDGVSYSTLNAEYYLNLLEKTVVFGASAVSTAPVPEFQAKRYLKRHPVRRYLARAIDYALLSTVLMFIVFVVLRVRFEVELLQNIVKIGCIFLSVPLNALLLSHFGTTPGKWVMGLHVLSCNGNRLSYEEAKDREWGALRYGCGFYLPIYTWIRRFKSYREYVDTYENCWYRDSEIIYELWSKLRRIIALTLVVICAFFALFTELHKQKPKYVGENITISQFSKNYNYVYEYLFGVQGEIMTTDGDFLRGNNAVHVDFGDGIPDPFYFELEGEYIKAIRFTTESLYVFEERELPPKCIAAAVCMAASQRNVNVFELAAFTARVRNAIMEAEGSGELFGEITVENVRATWREVMDIDNSLMNATYYFEVSLIN